MRKCKFNLCQACIIKEYNIEGIVSRILFDSRNINIQIEVEYLDNTGIIRKEWVNECELDFITIPTTEDQDVPSTEDIPTTEDKDCLLTKKEMDDILNMEEI
jgi:hypothetical protein